MSTTSEAAVGGLPLRMPAISRLLQCGVLTIAFIGMGVSAYLSFVHFSGLPVYCEASGGCETVQSSEYAELVGVPVALLGFILYTSIFVAGAAMLLGVGRLAEFAPYAVFGLALSGVLFSGYLTWLELYRIYAICAWCVASASLLAAIFALATAEIIVSGRWRSGEPEPE